MLRHVVMFKLKESAPASALADLQSGLAKLEETIDEIRSYEYGPDLGLRDGNFDFCLVAEFEDGAAFERYVVHSDHQRFIAERVAPVVAERVAVQYAL